MNTKKHILLALCVAATYGLSACGGDGHGHDHDGDHDHAGHSHKGGKGKDHDGDDHDHDEIVAGPNGGRVMHDFEPHAEFFVTDDRKVQITFVDDDMKAIPPGGQEVRVIAGDRSDQTKLTFAKSGDVLLSNEVLPEGNDFPVIVQVKETADAKSVNGKFSLNLAQCPTCDYKEYACACDHGDHEGHDHDEDE